jgi:hypothetical protein
LAIRIDIFGSGPLVQERLGGHAWPRKMTQAYFVAVKNATFALVAVFARDLARIHEAYLGAQR